VSTGVRVSSIIATQEG